MKTFINIILAAAVIGCIVLATLAGTLGWLFIFPGTLAAIAFCERTELIRPEDIYKKNE